MTTPIQLSLDHLKKWCPSRSDDAHKGECGRVAVIAGSLPMLGAAIHTAKAALRTGAGLVYLFTIQEALPALNIQHPDLIVEPLPSRQGAMQRENADQIITLLEKYDITAIAIGPGMGQHNTTQELITHLLHDVCPTIKIPVVIDADALNATTLTSFQGKYLPHYIFTPHPKEFTCLTSIPVSKENRLQAIQEAVTHLNSTWVLKGHQSLIASPEAIAMNTAGNPGMAVGGSGDVLTGIITTLCAQQVPTFWAAACGVHLHAMAGDLAFERYHYGLVASDMIDTIGEVLKKIYN